ncbi:maternal effect protein staufen-like isoform X2 [Dendroctonus ponderosae]|nr:maternal effect protein staufen-like isoform X2 [Dendroctonus ponderosae]
MSYAEGDKSAMSFINELAQFNDISYSYELVREDGPAHSKTFTVTLYLGDEQYTSEMQSIKKAQQAAAKTAIKSTKYEHPPVKMKESDKALTPTVLLNNLAAKLGLVVSYKRVFDDIVRGSSNKNDAFSHKKSYLQKLNDTVHMNDTIHVRRDGGDTKGPFIMSVEVNGKYFFGKAHTLQNSKHEAAAKALKSLKEDEESFYCHREDDNCNKIGQKPKSPISLVYEAAQKRNLGVTFEVIDEVGPSHKKIFTTKCVVGDLTVTGEGKSKKESKRVAAENVLTQLMKITEVSGKHVAELPRSKKSNKNKKNKVIKTTFDKIERMFDNAVDYGKGLVDTVTGNKKPTDDSKSHKNDASKAHRSPTTELFKIGKILDLNIQYLDFVERAKSYSLLDLGYEPPFICLGEGVSQKNSRDLAAKYGTKMLYRLGALDNLLDKSMKISNVLDKEEEFEMLWLEVANSNEDKKA